MCSTTHTLNTTPKMGRGEQAYNRIESRHDTGPKFNLEVSYPKIELEYISIERNRQQKHNSHIQQDHQPWEQTPNGYSPRTSSSVNTHTKQYLKQLT